MPEIPELLNFAFPEQPSKDSPTAERRLRLQEIRDGHAALFLSSALGSYCRGVFIDNPYPHGYSLEAQEKDIRRQCSSISTILLSTRPPLNDPPFREGGETLPSDGKNRRRIKRSGNWLEKRILEELGEVFDFCDRKTIKLNPARIQANPGNLEYHFQQNDEALVVPRRPSIERAGGQPRSWTVTYFLRLGALWSGGPDLVCAFGLSGPLTLIWCYLLANHQKCVERLRSVDGPQFLMARLCQDGKIPGDPHFLSFADEWDVKFLIDQELR